jgi:hypothetical protein
MMWLIGTFALLIVATVLLGAAALVKNRFFDSGGHSRAENTPAAVPSAP